MQSVADVKVEVLVSEAQRCFIRLYIKSGVRAVKKKLQACALFVISVSAEEGAQQEVLCV